MTDPRISGSENDEDVTDVLIERAWALVPGIRERAAEAEALRRVTDATIEEAARAELFQTMVPKRWGGHGQGLRALCELGRVLAHGDASTAWTLTFLIEHSFMACKLPIEAQQELFAERPYILAAAPLIPYGSAVRVDGGFRISGKWRYASAVMNAEHVFVTSPAEENGEQIPYTFLLPVTDVTVHDEWFMSGMCATSSTQVSAIDLFVPERFSIETELFHSPHNPGAQHEESIYRYPILPLLGVFMCGLALGCAEATLQLGRERLSASVPWGVRRLEREMSRTRWGAASQHVRCADLLWRQAMSQVIAKGEAEEPWTLEEQGQLALDILTVAHLSKDAVRLILDGAGSSAFQLSNPLQRYLRDTEVIANHVGHDWDTVSERGSRWLLGLGRVPTDPFPPRTSPRIAAQA
jgi:alkylation response protein AidB-like acyl-CoA dehydrogenase